MADLQRTIEIIFAGVDNVGPTVQSVGRSLDDFQGKVGSVTGPVSDWTKTLLQAELAIVGMGAAMAGLAVTQAGKFEGAVQEIGTLFAATDEQVRELADGILEFSQNSGKSIDEITASVRQAISTGTDYADAIAFVAGAEQLAVTGRASLAEVTAVLTAVMNAYGASADEASHYSDILFTTVQKGDTSVPKLASSLSAVTSIASAAGVSFADVSAAIAAITASGTGTSETVTQLRALITELLKPSDSLKEALGAVSLEADGLDGVIAKLADATGGSAEKMVQLFGSTEAVQAALTLANDSAGNYAAAITAMGDAMGVTEREAERMIKQFAEVNQTFANIIQATFIKAGLPILDEYNDVVGALGDLFKGVQFSLDSGAFEPIYDAIEDGSDVITEFLKGVAEALPAALDGLDFDVLLKAFDRVSKELGNLFGNLDLTKPEDLQRAIQALVNGVAALTNYSASAVEGMGPLIRKLADLIDKANDGDSSLLNLIGKLMGATTVINALLPGLELLANAMILLGGARALGTVVPSMGSFAAVAGSSAKVMALLVNPVTLLAAGLGVLAYNFNDVVTYVEEYIAGLLDLETRAERTTKETEALAQMFEKNRKASEDSRDAVSKLAQELWGGKDAQEGMAQATDKATDALDGESGALTEYQKLAAQTEAMQKDFAARTAERAAEQARITEERRRATMALVTELESLTKGEFDRLDAARQQELLDAKRTARQEGWLQALEAEEQQRKDLEAQQEKDLKLQEKAADLLFRQTEQANEFALELERIYSEERVKELELKFDLNIEEVRQNAETARAIISSVGDTINSTGETLVGLAELLTGFGSTSSSGYREIMEIIQDEEARRDEAIKMQQEITRAQVEQMDAQTDLLRQRADAYARGDAAITINGDGLQPHLEAFMWEILETIQTRVNAEGHALLLGT